MTTSKAGDSSSAARARRGRRVARKTVEKRIFGECVVLFLCASDDFSSFSRKSALQMAGSVWCLDGLFLSHSLRVNSSLKRATIIVESRMILSEPVVREMGGKQQQ